MAPRKPAGRTRKGMIRSSRAGVRIQPRLRAGEHETFAVEINSLGALPQPLPCFVPNPALFVDVNLFSPLSLVGKYANVVRKDFHDAAFERHGACFARDSKREYADLEFTHERRVAGQHAEIAGGGGSLHFVDFLVDELPFRDGDFQRELACHCLRSRFLDLLRFFDRFFDAADEVESLLRQIVVLAFNDFPEPANGVGEVDVLPLKPRELRGHKEGL